MHVTVESADTYFSTNFLYKEAWEVTPFEDKFNALNTAEGDIYAFLRVEEDNVSPCAFAEIPPFTALQKAIFEWAMYLYKNKDMIIKTVESRAYGISTTQVEGLGRETQGNMSKRYMDAYTDIIGRSPAAKFLSTIKRDVRLVR